MNIILQSQPVDREDTTLEDFFKEFGKEDMPDDCKAYAALMLKLLHYFKSDIAETDKWAYTGHHYVTLRDPQRVNGVDVTINAWNGQYILEYGWYLPDPPWTDAKVVRHTTAVAKAAEMILVVLGVEIISEAETKVVSSMPQSAITVSPDNLPQAYSSLSSHPNQSTTTKQRGVSAQHHEIKAYYEQIGPNETFPLMYSHAMLLLLRHLEENNIGTDLWWSTVSMSLVLTDADRTEEGIKVSPTPAGYSISYPASPPETLWENARVVGHVAAVEEAAQMIQTAIRRTFHS